MFLGRKISRICSSYDRNNMAKVRQYKSIGNTRRNGKTLETGKFNIYSICIYKLKQIKIIKYFCILFQEHLSLTNNQLERLYGELTELACLRTLNIRQNNIKSSGIPAELFYLEELTTLDLSKNNLREIPEGLEKARSLLNLNLSYNQ